MIIVNIPIEPLEERYSIQWDHWFTREFIKELIAMYEVTSGSSETSGKINTGSFLDVVETNMFKLNQTLEIIDLMPLWQKEKDETFVLFFHDLWHPGLSNIAYVRDGLGLKNVKICGCLHAGSYDEYDFLNKQGMSPWASSLEQAWFGKIVDKIFVATKFHKYLLCSRRSIQPDKVEVTGFPMYGEDFVPSFSDKEMPPKENIVVFPHRLDSEKQPKLFDLLISRLAPMFPDWRFVKSKEVATTKKEYYELLLRSKIAVSFALQETWGIAMQEATLCGCIPLVPDRLSYTELYTSEFKYGTMDEMIMKLGMYMTSDPPVVLEYQRGLILGRGHAAIGNMIKAMRTL